jgi:hypothetical protein
MALPLWKWIIGSHHYAPRSPHVAPHIALGAQHVAGVGNMDPWIALALVGGTIIVGSFLLMTNRPTV